MTDYNDFRYKLAQLTADDQLTTDDMGYRLGFLHGYVLGYKQAEEDLY